MEKPKVIVIVGPTASGKSALAVEIAKKFDGEIISIDSRQVYKGLDIGTGKITKEEMSGIPHHLLDVTDPKGTYTVADFKKSAEEKIIEILKRKKLPILCGGTGFYIQAVIDDVSFPEVMPNPELRKELDAKTTEELTIILEKIDPERVQTIDLKNPRRLIRAIEIATALGKVPKFSTDERYDSLFIGIQTETLELKKKIALRLESRLQNGMIEEAENLHTQGLSFERMEDLGLEYRYLAKYLKKELSLEEMSAKLETEIGKYAKRQMTWFKKDTRIHWYTLAEKNQIDTLMKGFLEKTS